MISLTVSLTTSTTISEINSRTTFLRVSTVTPELSQACDRSRPKASRRSRLLLAKRGRRSRGELHELVFEGSYSEEPFIPAPFEVGGDETIFRIHGIVLTMRPASLKSDLFQCVFQLTPLVRLFLLEARHRRQRGFDAERLHAVDDLLRDGTIDPHSAK